MTTSSAVATIYSKFGLTQTASTQEITSVFLRLATQYHPSKFPGDDKAEARFQQLASAYFVLSDAQERQRYDDYLQNPGGVNFKLSKQPPRASEVFEQLADRRAAVLVDRYSTSSALNDALLSEGFPATIAQVLADRYGKPAQQDSSLLTLDGIPSSASAASPTSIPSLSLEPIAPKAEPETAPPPLPAFSAAPTPQAQPYAPPRANAPEYLHTDEEETVYAGFWVRLAAFLLDIVFMNIAAAIAGGIGGLMHAIILGPSPQGPHTVFNLGQVIGLVVGIIYFSVQESSSAMATLGKRILGVQVISTDGYQISYWRALGRWAARWLSAVMLCLGYLIQPFTEKKQTLHDIVCSTIVIQKPGRKQSNIAAFIIIAAAVVIVMVIASIAIPAMSQYQDKALVKIGMMESRNAITSLIAEHGAGTPFPEKKTFAHSAQGIESIEFEKSQSAVIVHFNRGALKDKVMVAYPSAKSMRPCFFIDDYTSKGINECPANEPSALSDDAEPSPR